MRCTDLSIRTKILATNACIMCFLIAVAGYVWLAIDRIDSRNAELDRSVHLQEVLLEREMDHLKWVQKVLIFAGDPMLKSVDVQSDDHVCAFGAWYYGPERTVAESRFPAIKDSLRLIEAPHAKLHQSAVRLAELRANGDQPGMQALIAAETLPNLRQIQEFLGRVRATIDQDNTLASTLLDREFTAAKIVILVATFAAFCCAALISILSARSIARPIRELVTFSGKVAAGRYDHTLNLNCTNELGELASSLSTTVTAMHNQIAFNQGVLNGLTVPCSIFSRDDTTLFTNQLMLDLIERSGQPSDYYGQKSGQYIWGDASRETVSTAALRENRLITLQREITTHRGATRHVAISSSPFTNSAGEILGTISVWIDMTEVVSRSNQVQQQNAAMLEVATQLQNVVSTVSSAAEQLSAQVEQSSQGARKQAQRMTETATAMEEMTSTVIEVARNAARSADTTNQARTRAQNGATLVEAVVGSIREVQTRALGLKDEMATLGHQADGIGQIVNVISDIADQTNLLALNAAIEAARAGDAGRGFAVVADEVRKLAEKTMAATHEVINAVGAIQQGTLANITSVDATARSIEDVTRLATDSGAALREIVALVEAASDQARNIATASEEQSATSEEINRSVDEVHRVSVETAQAMDQAATAVLDLARQAQVLSTLGARMSTTAI